METCSRVASARMSNEAAAVDTHPLGGVDDGHRVVMGKAMASMAAAEPIAGVTASASVHRAGG